MYSAQGSSDRDAFKPYFEYTAGILYYLGFDILETVIAAGTDVLEISFRPQTLEKAKELGKLISAPRIPNTNFNRVEHGLTPSL